MQCSILGLSGLVWSATLAQEVSHVCFILCGMGLLNAIFMIASCACQVSATALFDFPSWRFEGLAYNRQPQGIAGAFSEPLSQVETP